MKKFKKLSFFILFVVFSFVFISTTTTASNKGNEKTSGSDQLVYIIPVENDVERGLESFIKRTTKEAEDAFADHIIFEIDTPGGRVDAAKQIGKIIQGLTIETTSFITSDALSAGSYIALNTDNIYMAPQSTMGASGIITADGNAADKKARSAWIAAMKSAAESKGRDPIYAAAMADENIDLPEYEAPKGEFLTLDAKTALEVDYANGIVKHRTALFDKLNLQEATVEEMEPTTAEGIARFVTNPIVVPILLTVASLGFVVELYSPGFGIPGSMAIVSLILLFYGHIIAGLAGLEGIVLLVLGIGLIVLEFFIPGGIVGSIGVASVVASLLISGYSFKVMAYSIIIAIVIGIVTAILLYKYFGLERGLFKHLILTDQTTTKQGYVSNKSRNDLLDKIGITLTPLRPAGTVAFNDERVDVVSEGSFVEKDKKVKVIQVEGGRVVVREI